MAYANDGNIGVNLEAVPTSSNEFTLGMMVQGNNGSNWMWVLAPTALTTGDFVGVNAATYTVSAMTNAVAVGAGSMVVGWAQTSFPASTYGWIALKGAGIKVRVTAGTAISPGLPLYTSDAAGVLTGTTNSVSGFQVFGVTLYTTASGATATASSAGVSEFPTIRRPA